MKNKKGITYFYELYAVLRHLGSTVENGHYVTKVRDIKSESSQWYKCDDEHILPIKRRKKRYADDCAIALFY